ncbi:VOC family protein [Limimaricola pyoseonensis]|uniref:VOC domain-containing protein n=1 Tax=Limimaricola pyoseonensis TaxID=521013 RepID=A0A1G7I3H3_9RHOB|nr:VOC family protein [Limimaricola pyoseonensis]SDF07282.1 hypothetical protein SAMN04488567_3317 [Limimaricola pyoseonensis]
MRGDHGTIWWLELVTEDVKAACAFYEATCGWSFVETEVPSGHYWVAHENGRPVAGIMAEADLPTEKHRLHGWVAYLAVEDVEASAQAIERLGGRILRPPFDAAGIGRICLARDPGGAPLGFVQPLR